MKILFFTIFLFSTSIVFAQEPSNEAVIHRLLEKMDAVKTVKEPIEIRLPKLKLAQPNIVPLIECVESHTTNNLVMRLLTDIYIKHISSAEALSIIKLLESPGVLAIIKSRSDAEGRTAEQALTKTEIELVKINANLLKRLSGPEIIIELDEAGRSMLINVARTYCGHLLPTRTP